MHIPEKALVNYRHPETKDGKIKARKSGNGAFHLSGIPALKPLAFTLFYPITRSTEKHVRS